MKITEHFTLEELSFSEAAARLGLDNTPMQAVITNLGLVAAVMEGIRTLLGDRPIVVHSGYRSAEVNQAVGGVATSAHCRGLACDNGRLSRSEEKTSELQSQFNIVCSI